MLRRQGRIDVGQLRGCFTEVTDQVQERCCPMLRLTRARQRCRLCLWQRLKLIIFERLVPDRLPLCGMKVRGQERASLKVPDGY